MKKKDSKEQGMVIVEATIVFPVMFLVILFMLFAGNAFYQKSRIEAYVQNMAIQGAAYCADPMLNEVKNGSIPGVKSIDIQPYRYLIGGMSGIEAKIESELTQSIREMNTGFFMKMEPVANSIKADFKNGFIYSTFRIDVEYKVLIPIRLLFTSEDIYFKESSHAEAAVSDTAEFIRNIDMIEDYIQKTGLSEEIQNLMNKAKEWAGK